MATGATMDIWDVMHRYLPDGDARNVLAELWERGQLDYNPFPEYLSEDDDPTDTVWSLWMDVVRSRDALYRPARLRIERTGRVNPVRVVEGEGEMVDDAEFVAAMDAGFEVVPVLILSAAERNAIPLADPVWSSLQPEAPSYVRVAAFA